MPVIWDGKKMDRRVAQRQVANRFLSLPRLAGPDDEQDLLDDRRDGQHRAAQTSTPGVASHYGHSFVGVVGDRAGFESRTAYKVAVSEVTATVLSMWDGEDPDLTETYEYVLGATAHLLAQMGDQQASLLLEDVVQLSFESEQRGQTEPNPWTDDGSHWPKNSNVYYFDTEPYLVDRFTPEVMERIAPVMRSLAQRSRLPVPEVLETRLAMPSIDTKTGASRYTSSTPTRTPPTRLGKSGWTRQSR